MSRNKTNWAVCKDVDDALTRPMFRTVDHKVYRFVRAAVYGFVENVVNNTTSVPTGGEWPTALP